MLWTSHLPTASLFLLLLPCFRGQNGGENKQSTDVVSVWEGESISITCSLSGNEETMHLTASIRQDHVLYVSKGNISRIYSNFISRVNYSEKGGKLTITLHHLQASDSDIYLCTKYVLSNDRHKKLNDKTTIVVVKGKPSGDVEQSPLYVNPQQGQSVSITCTLRGSDKEKGIYLLKTQRQPERVLYVSSQNASIISSAFTNRLEYSKEEKKIVITLHNLRKNDSDLYVCAGVLKKSSHLLASRSGTMVLVTEVEKTDCSNSSWAIYGLIIVVVVLLFSELLYCTLCRVNMKKYFKREERNAVYEDMSFSSRRSTLVRTNT